MRESSSTYFVPDKLKVIGNVIGNEHIFCLCEKAITHWYLQKYHVLMKILLCVYPNVFDFKGLFEISNSDIFQLSRTVQGKDLLNNKKSWLKNSQTWNK